MHTFLLLILKKIIDLIFDGFKSFFTTGFSNKAHRTRAYFMLSVLFILSVLSYYIYNDVRNLKSIKCNSIDEFAKRNIDAIALKNNFYKSISKEIRSCSQGVFTGKINFSKLSSGEYGFAFEYLLNNQGFDVRFSTPKTAALYQKQYLIIPNIHIGDIRIIQNSIHGKLYEASLDRLEALESDVFRQFFLESILKFKTIYYIPFYSEQNSVLLYVLTLSIVDGIDPICNPEVTLTNIFNHLVVYHTGQLKIYNI